jgi:DNA replication protein DnaC
MRLLDGRCAAHEYGGGELRQYARPTDWQQLKEARMTPDQVSQAIATALSNAGLDDFLDDFLITTPSLIEAKDLLEVIDDRSQLRSTVVVTQLPVEDWHTALTAGDPTLADAILDRLVHNAHRLSLRGSSLRRRQPPPADEPAAR